MAWRQILTSGSGRFFFFGVCKREKCTRGLQAYNMPSWHIPYNTPPTCLTFKSQLSSMAKWLSLLRLCYLPARPHKDQETLQALTEPGHEDFFGGGVVERVRQALSFAGQGSEGSAVSWESVWRGTFFIPKVNPCGKRKNRILEQLYHFRSGISCFICAAGLVWCLAWNHGLDFTSFESSLPDRSVPMTLTSGFVWGGPSLSKMQVGTLRANSEQLSSRNDSDPWYVKTGNYIDLGQISMDNGDIMVNTDDMRKCII